LPDERQNALDQFNRIDEKDSRMNQDLDRLKLLDGRHFAAPRGVTRRDLDSIMDRYPTLTAFGFGIFDDPRANTASIYQQRFHECRVKLLESVEQCSRAYQWLAPVAKIKTINERHSSYGLKHWVEQYNSPYYCSNGAFIAAALLLDFKVDRDGPNARFNMSQRSLNERIELSHRRFLGRDG
jgi:hypothetical protein